MAPEARASRSEWWGRRAVSGATVVAVVGLMVVGTAVPVAAMLAARSTSTGATTVLGTGLRSLSRATPAASQVQTDARTFAVPQESSSVRVAEGGTGSHALTPIRHAAIVSTHVTTTRSAATPTPPAKPVTPRPAATVRPTTTATATVTTTTGRAPVHSATHATPVGPSAAAKRLMAHLNPAQNITPVPDFLTSGPCSSQNGVSSCQNPCITPALTWPAFSDAVACNNFVLSAIDNARAREGLGPMTLPSNWYSLSTPEQLFTVVNLERTARGLPAYLGINAALSSAAQRAAETNNDPALVPGFPVATTTGGVPAWGGAWAGGFSVLAADYIWMYDDGWGGSRAATSNIACTSPGAGGCWGHRDELLGYDPGYNPGVGLDASSVEVGVGFAQVGSASSFAVLIERTKGAPPAMTFTWANGVAPYL